MDLLKRTMWIRHLKMSAIKNKRGFSLIEIVVSMAVVAVLSTAAVVSYRGYKQQVRTVKARNHLGYMMIQAEAYRANAGFFLPNLEEMNITLEGVLEYGISVLCEDGTSDVVYSSDQFGADWENSTKACGSFTDPTPAPSPPPNCICPGWGSSGECWMGYVLHHSYNICGLPAANADEEDQKYECGSSEKEKLYKTGGRHYTNVQFEDICSITDPTEKANAVTERKKRFIIKDSYGMCHKDHLAKDSDIRSIAESCAHSKAYAMPHGDIEDIYEHAVDVPDSDDGPFKLKNLISGPGQLVLTAIGCTKKQAGGCSQSHNYNIMSISSNKEIYYERTNQKP